MSSAAIPRTLLRTRAADTFSRGAATDGSPGWSERFASATLGSREKKMEKPRRGGRASGEGSAAPPGLRSLFAPVPRVALAKRELHPGLTSVTAPRLQNRPTPSPRVDRPPNTRERAARRRDSGSARRDCRTPRPGARRPGSAFGRTRGRCRCRGPAEARPT